MTFNSFCKFLCCSLSEAKACPAKIEFFSSAAHFGHSSCDSSALLRFRWVLEPASLTQPSESLNNFDFFDKNSFHGQIQYYLISIVISSTNLHGEVQTLCSRTNYPNSLQYTRFLDAVVFQNFSQYHLSFTNNRYCYQLAIHQQS